MSVYTYKIASVSWYPNLQQYVARVIDREEKGPRPYVQLPVSLLKAILEKVGQNAADAVHRLNELVKAPPKIEDPSTLAVTSILARLASITLTQTPIMSWDKKVMPTFDLPIARHTTEAIMDYFNKLATEVADTQIENQEDFQTQVAKQVAALVTPFPYFYHHDHYTKARQLWQIEYDANLRVSSLNSVSILKVEAFVQKFQERVQRYASDAHVVIQKLDSYDLNFVKCADRPIFREGRRIYLLSIGEEKRVLAFDSKGIEVMGFQDAGIFHGEVHP